MSEKIRVLEVGNDITAATIGGDIEIAQGDDNIVVLTPEQLKQISDWAIKGNNQSCDR